MNAQDGAITGLSESILQRTNENKRLEKLVCFFKSCFNMNFAAKKVGGKSMPRFKIG